MSPQEGSWRLGRRASLDGIRGVAIILVILEHIGLRGLPSSGSVGVTLFFTLSGFLISTLMLDEHDSTGTMRLGAFYRRRAFRLLPALVVLLAGMLLAWRLIGPGAATPIDLLLALSFVGNWLSAAGVALHGVEHTWSLAVEEQFYLVWPLVFVLLSRLRRPKMAMCWVAGLGTIASVAIRYVEWDEGRGERWVYFATEARADALLIGCLLAIWMNGRRDRAAAPRLATLAVVAMVPLFATTSFARAVVLPTITPLLAVVLIVSVARGTYRGWLTAPWLVYLGRRSYARYLWNLPLLWIGPSMLPLPKGVATVLMLAATWGLTELSWKYVEAPFQARQRRSARSEASGVRGGVGDLERPIARAET
jgi:peptidoglycan/LPS O-acetylase OafA/YrhL